MAALEGGTRSHELAALYETRRSELAHSLTIDTPCRFWLRADGIDEMFKSLEVCGETLKAEILKVTLTAKSGGRGAVLDPLYSAILEQTNLYIEIVTQQFPSAGCGTPLSSIYVQHVMNLLSSLAELLSVVEGGDDKRVTLCTAAVLDCIGQFSQLVKSNKQAYRRQFMQTSGILRDMIDEFGETGESGVEVDPFDDFAFDEKHSAEELPVVNAVNALFVFLRAMAKTSLNAVEALGGEGSEASLSHVHRIWTIFRDMDTVATDVGSALYAPIDKDELSSELQGLIRLARDVSAELTSCAAEGLIVGKPDLEHTCSAAQTAADGTLSDALSALEAFTPRDD